MKVKKIGCLVAVLAPFAMLGVPAARANGASAPAKTVVATPAVLVKLGDAVLEEYHGGDPVKRTTLVCGSDVAQAATGADCGKKHS